MGEINLLYHRLWQLQKMIIHKNKKLRILFLAFLFLITIFYCSIYSPPFNAIAISYTIPVMVDAAKIKTAPTKYGIIDFL